MKQLTCRRGWCKHELEPGQFLLQELAAAEAEDKAAFWRSLYGQTRRPDAMFWSHRASHRLQQSAKQVCAK